MPAESISKRCTCTDTNGRQLGTRCPKLHRPGGGWHPTHGTWRYQLELPPHPDGRRRQLRRSGFPDRDTTIRERDHAKTLLNLAGDDLVRRSDIATLLQSCRPGTPLPDPDTITATVTAETATAAETTLMADYLPRWLSARRGLSPKTIRSYSDHIRLYLIPHLGDHTVEELQPEDIEAMYTALETRNTDILAARNHTDPAVRATVRGVRTLSEASMQRLRATLRKALNDAIKKYRLRTTNPAEAVELAPGRPPKPRIWTDKAIQRWAVTKTRPSSVMVWKPQQAGQFLDYTETHDLPLYALYLLILHRGLRRGETCGLRDEDVDLDAGTLTIVEQVTLVGYQPVTKKVKSEAGDRVIPLGPRTIAVLHAYLAMRQRWQQKLGTDWPDSGTFFVRPDGQPWHPQAVSDHFDKLIATSGLPPVRLHDLRHCAATYLRHGGADMKEIQETLGHHTIGITADIYTSLILELRNETADAAADVIPRAVAVAA